MRVLQVYAGPMTEGLTLEPDPFDKVVEAILNDPEVRASLDEQDALFQQGKLKTYTNEEVRARLQARGVSLPDDAPTAE
jgi:hypothetical protein